MKTINFFITHVNKFAFLGGIIALMILGTSCGRAHRPAGISFEHVNYSNAFTIVNDSIATRQYTGKHGVTFNRVYKLNKTNNKYFICR